MADTTALTVEQAAESLLAPVETKIEIQESEVETETDAAPVVEDQTDADEVEADEEDGDDTAEADEPESVEQDEGEEEPDADEEQPESYTVKVNGEEVAVSLDELKRGYSGNAYVQKGMQENAALRKQFEQNNEALQHERQQLIALATQLQQGGLQQPTRPDPDLINSDPIGFMEQQARYERDMEAYQGKMSELRRHAQQQAEQTQRANQEYLQSQAELLTQFIPEFADPEKGREMRGKLRETGVNYGFSEEEITGISDARMVRVLNDARKYRELQTSKKTAEKKIKQARPMVKAGSKPKSDPKAKARNELRSKLRKTGSIADAAALLLE